MLLFRLASKSKKVKPKKISLVNKGDKKEKGRKILKY